MRHTSSRALKPSAISAVALAVACLAHITAAGAAAAPRAAFAPASTPALPAPPSPALIERAVDRGAIGEERANLYRVYALTGDSRLPAAYESDTPFDGTVVLLRARRELPRMEPGPERREVTTTLRAPPDPNPTSCDSLSTAPLPNSTETEHFYIQYNASALEGSLTIEDYKQSLEAAWLTEVGVFGWAPPPANTAGQTALDGKYHVRVDAFTSPLYGFVSTLGTYAGRVGNNPATPWDEGDADASCMALNRDFAQFPGSARQALDATTAHELNHSLQFGYGALSGANVPDDHFLEGAATWMEDEVQDAANDNYNYLYPAFADSMGEHEGNVYAYWLTFRGLTERFGTGAAGGGEQVMQDFWELTSRNEASNLTAMQQALASKGTTLADAYHAYAVAAKLLRPCGGGYVLPYCFEEGPGYQAARGQTQPHGAVAAIGGAFSGAVEDDYALNWVTLPTGGPYDVTLANASGGGRLRATVACDTGSAVRLAPLPAVVSTGGQATLSSFDPAGCANGTPVAVITNEAQTAANPAASEARAYTLRVAPPGTGGSDPGPGGGPGPGSTPGAGAGSTPSSGAGTPSGSGAATGTGAGAAPTPTPPPARDAAAPRVGRVALARRRFLAAGSGSTIAATRGTLVRYSLNETAIVTIRFVRQAAGRRVAGRCRRATARTRRRPPCLRAITLLGSGQAAGGRGVNSFRLTGRLGGRALPAGLYELRLSARDAAGNTSGARRSPRFRIISR